MYTLPLADAEVSALSYGCMRIVGTWNPSEITDEKKTGAFAALDAALDAGYTLFDHADIYCSGGCETVFGEWLAAHPGVRENLYIATKCGIRFPGDPHPDSPHRYDFSLGHILESCEKSRERLGIDIIDLYQLHRPDVLMDPREVVEAFDELESRGWVRHFGVSNFSPSFVSTLQNCAKQKIVVNQVEIHLGRLDPFVDGTLDQCLRDDILPLAWSPLGGGWLGDGRTVPVGDPRESLLLTLDEIAARLEVSRTVLSLAWLMKHPSRIVPIVGSVRPEKIRDAATAAEVEISREDWYRIYTAASGKALP
ncbi:aldo/keto reductase [soil metagenome]